MKIKLRELTLKDDKEIFDMLQEIGPGENGFDNSANDYTFNDWPKYLEKYHNYSKGLNLKPGYVKQTTYWLFIDDKPVGISKLRHSLTEKLIEKGGHIGYSIRPSQRNKGYGKIILRETLKKAAQKGIKQALITCHSDNIRSKKVIESAGGELQDIYQNECRYWIKL